MAAGTHTVVVWVGTRPGEDRLFTLTARDATGAAGRLAAVEAGVRAAGYVEARREPGLTRDGAAARKRALAAEYTGRGFARRTLRQLAVVA